ncbi:hypothetical protein EG343_07120 [Chryseobacterium nakagawai]|uniref:Uncharacterized protein n=2 Tax=Chryseobacterium nakagawai TaxID=1241982 RepID=A0AAD0YK68_CHRNA|nr:hypothetical protein EG343_07120 [Chryseobacterium nakagawai]
MNAQQKTPNPAQKFSTIKIDDISKENLIIPTYETLVSYAKQKQPVNEIFYTETYNQDTNTHTVELKDKADSVIPLTTYEFKDGVIYSIMTGKRDIQKYTRTTENSGYTQQFSNAIQTQIDFYKNGFIHTIRHFGYGIKASGYPAGIWYAYSEDGTLQQKIDHDSHFRMNFYDLLAIADSFGSPYIGINRAFNDIHSYWYILLFPHPEDRTTKERTLLIDDKTGQIIYSIVDGQKKYLKTKTYDSLNLSKESLKWLLENDKYYIPDEEFYKLFRGYW